jgi:hypothetical protein
MLESRLVPTTNYNYSLIADDTGSMLLDGTGPAISSNGIVAFLAYPKTATTLVPLPLTGTGGALTPIASVGDNIAGGAIDGLNASLLSVNGSGTVAFEPDINVGGGNSPQAVLAGNGGPLAVIGPPPNPTPPPVLPGYFGVSINDSGQVAMTGSPTPTAGWTISLGNGNSLQTLYDSNTLGLSLFGEYPVVNDGGTVAFTAETGNTEILLAGNGGSVTTIASGTGAGTANADGYFFDLSSGLTAINNQGAVAFEGTHISGQNSDVGIFVGDGGAVTTVADQAVYSYIFGGPAINDSGTIIFSAQPIGGGLGLFSGPDPHADKILQAGDPLFGSTVTEVITGNSSLNNRGQIAMWVSLADGRNVIVRANPVTQPTVTVVDAGGTYNGEFFPATATASGVDGSPVNGSFAFTYYLGTSASGAGSGTAPIDAGVYTVVAAFTSNDPSYTDAQSAPVTFTISRATPQLAVHDDGGAYNGQPFAASAAAMGVDGAAVSGAFAFTYTDSQGNASSLAPTNAGAYTVVASFASANSNYSDAQSAPLQFTIARATPSVTVSDAGGVYNGQPFAASASATGIGGSMVAGAFAFSYYTGTTTSGPGSPIAPTLPGAYTVVAAFTSADANYADAQSRAATFTIAAPVVSPYAGSYGGAFQGTATLSGLTTPVSGPVAFTVDSAGRITVILPGLGHGTVALTGAATIAGNGTIDSISVSYSYTGAFMSTGSASGDWTATFPGGTATGAWHAARQGLVAPILIGPRGVIGRRPTFTWNAVPSATFYQLRVFDVTANSYVSNAKLIGTSFTPARLLAAGHAFHWQVRALASSGALGPWSPAVAVRVPLVGPPARQFAFEGNFAGSQQGWFTPSRHYLFKISGHVTFALVRDGAFSDHYHGVLTVDMTAVATKISGDGDPTLGPSRTIVTVPIQATGHQTITGQAPGAGFNLTFNGFVSPGEMDVKGTISVALTDPNWMSDVIHHTPLVIRMGGIWFRTSH